MSADARVVVKVKPGAKAPGFVVTGDGEVEIRVRERAIDGKATRAAGTALAAALGVPASHITLVRGAAARVKAFSVRGLSEAEVRTRLSDLARGERAPRAHDARTSR